MNLIKDLIIILSGILFICAIVESNELTTKRNNCPEQIRMLNGSETEYFNVNFEEECAIYTYQVKCVNKSSIIKIKSTFTDHSNLTSSKDVQPSQIHIDLKEKTTLSDGSKSLVAVNKWIIDSKNRTSTKGQIFFSRTADLTISVTIKGNWPDIDLDFSYEEVEFVEYRNSSSDREGSISPWVPMEGRGYRPNTVYVFQITKPKDLKASSIHLYLNKLQIDEGIEEYLLVGAGKDIFQGPPPLFISSLPSKKEIKINDENAYIVFVATSTRSYYSGFEITWKYNGTSITRKEDVTVDPAICDESDSMPICIYNITAALNELNKSEDSFGKFRERLASLGNEYAKNISMNSKIDSSQVRIVRVSAVIDKNDTVYVMVKIQNTEDSRAAFNWHQMGHILREYSSRHHSAVDDGYWINACPKEAQKRNQTNILFYVIAAVLCCLLFVLVWNWNQTPLSRMFSKQIKNVIMRTGGVSMVPQEEDGSLPNHFPGTVPQLCYTDDDGRRHTLNVDGELLSSGGEDSDREVFNRANLRRSNSSQSNARQSGSVRSSTRSLREGVINNGYQEDEENTPGTSTAATNTVNSQKSLLGSTTNITDETKL